MKRPPHAPQPPLHSALAVTALVLLAVAAVLSRPATSIVSTQPFSTLELTLRTDDRILILAPHPDDESLACGGVIQKALSMGLPVRVVFLTNGDANEWSFVLYQRRPELLPGQVEAMGLVRHDEAVAAAKILGLTPQQLTFLGYPDFGTLEIWTQHWGEQPPLRGLFTRTTQVPYASAYRPGAAYKGEEIVADLEAILKEFQPTRVFLSHPADHNTDHMALYAFTHVALWNLGLTPELYPYLVHAPRWPDPRGSAPTLSLTPPAGLADLTTWWTLPLSPAEVSRKLSALEAHRTQFDSNSRYLASFIRANELFGDYPPVALPGAEAELNLETAEPRTLGPEELSAAEQAKFVGAEWHRIRREGNDLILTLALSRPLAEGVGLSVDLFGYRSDRAFVSLPKIHIKVGELSQGVYDQSRRVPYTRVQVKRDAHHIELRVPLALLGDPDRALINVRTYLGDVPLDSAAWRVLDFRGQS